MTLNTASSVRAACLGKVDERINELVIEVNDLEQITPIARIEIMTALQRRELGFLRALKAVIGECANDGYATWDTTMVPLIDGKYDVAEMERWERIHGHDIRLKCYPENGCMLLVDPMDLMMKIVKELGLHE